MEATRAIQAYCSATPLYMALELSASKWVLLFGDGVHGPRRKTSAAGDLQAVQHEMALAKAKFGLPAQARVISCYEAGRDGFWIARWLDKLGVENLVVDAASIEVPRRGKRVKTDRIDAEKLLELLMRWSRGERRVWRLVRVPTVEQEDRRRMHRERERLKKEATSASNRIAGLLATQGVRVKFDGQFPKLLQEARCWDGAPVPPMLRAELLRQWERHLLAQRQRHALERQQREHQSAQMRQLQRLRGIGPLTPWVLCTEVFEWREIANGRQLSALAGFTPTPYDSGDSHREQGISKAGIRRLRPAMIELAWLWLLYQRDSALARWFQQRFGTGSKRSRRIGIVALARKLLVALWRYVHDGVVPQGAVLKPA